MQTHEILELLQSKLSPNIKLSPEKLGKTLSGMGFQIKKSKGLNYRIVREKKLADTKTGTKNI